MNNKLFFVIGLALLMSMSVFSAAPTLSAITATPIYATDHNYGNWKPTNNITLNTLVTGADLNKDGCGYAINGSWTYPTAVDLNTDTNILAYTIMSTTTDDINWGLSCANTSGEEGFAFRTIYLDANSPLSGASFDNDSTLTLTTSDYATNTGNGSGIKNLFYRINDGTWVDLGAVTQSDLVLGVGNYVVDYYAVDNLDNNEWVTEGDYWTTTFSVQKVSDCGTFVWIAGLLMIMLAYFVVMRLMNGQFDSKTIGLVVGIIIAIYIIYAFSSGVCVL
jgi:hypothetical protein